MGKDGPDPDLAGALLAGVLFSAASNWYAYTLGYPTLEFDPTVLLISFPTLLLLGTIPAFTAFRHRLVAPSGVLLVAVSLWIESEADPGPGDPFVGYLALTPLYAAFMLAAAWAELRFRTFLADR